MTNRAPFPVSDHCDGHRFFNPGGHELPRFHQILRWKLFTRPKAWPKQIPVEKRARPALPRTALRATWINHSTFLVETPQGNLLTDPVFSPCCGPFGKIGPRRAHLPGIELHELPEIHYLLLSHDHYDHCDLTSLQQIAQAHDPLAISSLGNKRLLSSAGFSRVVELDWWQNHSPVPTLQVTATPAQHWSKRLNRGHSTSLWAGFFVHAGARRLYFAGDTGYNAALFPEIRSRLGSPDLAFIPIGAYEPRSLMRNQHCNPEEALQIHSDLGAATSIGMHWGTFQLTDEGREDPKLALLAALKTRGPDAPDFRVIAPAESIVLNG
jgi:L-ascorbate metabolism protein UlaG (beta-lactamase superfamily)